MLRVYFCLLLLFVSSAKAEQFYLDLPDTDWHLTMGYAGYQGVGFDTKPGAEFSIGHRLGSHFELALNGGFTTYVDENYRQSSNPAVLIEGGEQNLYWAELMVSDIFMHGQWQFSKHTYIDSGLVWMLGAGVTNFSDDYYPTFLMGVGIRSSFDRFRIDVALKDHIFKFEEIETFDGSYAHHLQLGLSVGVTF